MLKKVRIILLTIVIFWGTLRINSKFFSKRDRNFKHFKLCKINNKHPFITILKRSLFCLFFLLLLCKTNNIKTNFEVLKSHEVLKSQYSKEIFIKKTETKKILSYYALSKIHIHKHKSYFRFILLLSGYINLSPGPYTDILTFSNSRSSINYSRISLASNDENPQALKNEKILRRKIYI